MIGTSRRTIKHLLIHGESEQLTPKPFVQSLPFHPATVSGSADRKAGKRVISSIYVQQHGVKQLKTNREFFCQDWEVYPKPNEDKENTSTGRDGYFQI